MRDKKSECLNRTLAGLFEEESVVARFVLGWRGEKGEVWDPQILLVMNNTQKGLLPHKLSVLIIKFNL